jgi:hypothetical protein
LRTRQRSWLEPQHSLARYYPFLHRVQRMTADYDILRAYCISVERIVADADIRVSAGIAPNRGVDQSGIVTAVVFWLSEKLPVATLPVPVVLR